MSQIGVLDVVNLSCPLDFSPRPNFRPVLLAPSDMLRLGRGSFKNYPYWMRRQYLTEGER
ncbi:unnamed protein product [Penicillium manginii]